MSEPVEVRIECPCPDKPHAEGDTVKLRPALALRAGIAVQKLVIEANQAEERFSSAELTGLLAEGYLRYGIESWTLVDGAGKPEPCTVETISRHLETDPFSVWSPAADKADDLYLQAVLVPLFEKASNSSAITPINGSTSATRKPRTRKAKQSSPSTRRSSDIQTLPKPSSTTTTPMDGTTLISLSPAGVSNS